MGKKADPAVKERLLPPEAEARYRAYAEVAGQLAWVTNADGELEEDAPLWRKYTGQSFEEIKGWGWLTSIHPDDAERVTRAWEKALTTRTPYEIEYRVCRHDGVYRHFLGNAVPLLTEDGTVHEWLGTCIDITERTRTEEKVLQLAALVESSDDAIIGMTLDGVVRSWNTGAERTYGYPELEIIGSSFSRLVPPERENELPEILARIVEGEHIERYETVRRRKDGIDIHMSLIISPITDRDGRIVGASSIGRDITAAKKAEAAHVTSQIQLSETMDLARIVHWQLDWATETFTFNDAFYTFYATTAEREGGYRMAAAEYSKRFVYPDDRAMVRESSQKNRLGQENEFVVDLEHRIVRRDGQVRHILARTRGFRDADGNITRCYGANQDVTERKVAEEEKAALETQLRQAQKMEAIGTFSAAMAHDFKNILVAIEGFANLGIRHIREEGKARRCLERISQAVQRGSELIGQILTFSRKGEEGAQKTDMLAAVQEALAMLRVSLPRTIEIRESFFSERLLVPVKATQVQQIVMNLATNGAHAMKQGGGRLTVGVSDFALTAENAPSQGMTVGAYVRLTVTDTGSGMDKRTMKNLFDPFFSTKKRTEGTGLGLWMVYSIVTGYGGAITVRSAPGEGSTFDVFLPALPLEKGWTPPKTCP
jgi:PAS domain S-box-containing protein